MSTAESNDKNIVNQGLGMAPHHRDERVQFGLRGMFAAVTGTCVLFGFLAAMGVSAQEIVAGLFSILCGCTLTMVIVDRMRNQPRQDAEDIRPCDR